MSNGHTLKSESIKRRRIFFPFGLVLSGLCCLSSLRPWFDSCDCTKHYLALRTISFCILDQHSVQLCDSSNVVISLLVVGLHRNGFYGLLMNVFISPFHSASSSNSATVEVSHRTPALHSNQFYWSGSYTAVFNPSFHFIQNGQAKYNPYNAQSRVTLCLTIGQGRLEINSVRQ